jgi:hypothetical protein
MVEDEITIEVVVPPGAEDGEVSVFENMADQSVSKEK